MAYVLGFFAADGYITTNKQGGQYWCISITDGELLKQIREIINSEHKISVRKGKGSEKDQYRMQIGNAEMCGDLWRLGFKENKTKSLVVPAVPNKYLPDFVRGYFDGDGNVWTGLVHKERKTSTLAIQTVFTSCSRQFLCELKQKLDERLNVCGIIVNNKTFFRLQYSINSSLKLYDFMYNDLGNSKLFIERKKKVFEKYINAAVV